MRDWDFLNKELQAISSDSFTGARFVDKLIRVYLKNGDENWLLIHIEAQSSYDSEFSKRMFIYHYRCYDKFKRHPFCFAILTDKSVTWRPSFYQHTRLSCALRFDFPILKLIDLEQQRQFLEESNNPFACIIITQLNALKSKRIPNECYNLKIHQTKNLYRKGFSASIIRKLYHFIDALIRLPSDLDLKFKDDIFNFEEKMHMPYISSIEKFGIEKGIQQGISQGFNQGMQQVALRMIQKNQPSDFISEVTGLSDKELKELMSQA